MDVFPSMAASQFCRLTRASAHEPAVDFHQLARLPQVVVSSVSHPLRLNGENLRDVLALRYAPQDLTVPSGTVAEEMADLSAPFADGLRDRHALFTTALHPNLPERTAPLC